MSLTGHLRDKSSPIREFLRTRFPDTRSFLADDRKRIREADTLQTNAEVQWRSTIGAALDYRIRYYFGLTPFDQLIAYHGARYLTDSQVLTPSTELDFSWPGEMDDDVTVFDKHTGRTVWTYNPRLEFGHGPGEHNDVMLQAQELAHSVAAGEVTRPSRDRTPLRADLEGFLSSLQGVTSHNNTVGKKLTECDEDNLNRHCVVLALLEAIFRAGLRPGSPLSKGEFVNARALLDIVQQEWISDLRALSWIFYDGFNHLLPLNHVLNPRFDGSKDVGGADADLIVDGVLIDIKTTAQQGIRNESIWQLLGYVLLDYSDTYRINAVALYMARQGILFKWDLEDAVRCLYAGEPPSIEELRSKFKELARSSRQERVRMRRMRSRTTPSDAPGKGR